MKTYNKINKYKRRIRANKPLIITSFLVGVLIVLAFTGTIQLFIFGDYTRQFYLATGIHEDDKIIGNILETRRILINGK